MDESEVKHLEPARGKVAMKLSAAIYAGIAIIPEKTDYCGCAMGAAYTFITGRNLQIDQGKHPSPGFPDGCGWHLVAQMFGVPNHLAERVSRKHLYGDWSRAECAAYLELNGY